MPTSTSKGSSGSSLSAQRWSTDVLLCILRLEVREEFWCQPSRTQSMQSSTLLLQKPSLHLSSWPSGPLLYLHWHCSHKVPHVCFCCSYLNHLERLLIHYMGTEEDPTQKVTLPRCCGLVCAVPSSCQDTNINCETGKERLLVLRLLRLQITTLLQRPLCILEVQRVNANRTRQHLNPIVEKTFRALNSKTCFHDIRMNLSELKNSGAQRILNAPTWCHGMWMV